MNRKISEKTKITDAQEVPSTLWNVAYWTLALGAFAVALVSSYREIHYNIGQVPSDVGHYFGETVMKRSQNEDFDDKPQRLANRGCRRSLHFAQPCIHGG
jgi:hypothetical protein